MAESRTSADIFDAPSAGAPGGLSDVFQEMSLWSPINSEPIVSGNSIGIPSVILEDNDAANFGLYGITNNVPVTAAQTVRIRFVRDTTKTNAISLNMGDGVNGFSALAIRTDTGEVTPQVFNFVGADYSIPTVVSTNVTDETIEVVATLPPSASASDWSIRPANAPNSDHTNGDATQTGSIEILDLDLNYADPLAGTASDAFQNQAETLVFGATAVEGVSYTHDGTEGSNLGEIQFGNVYIKRSYIGSGQAFVEIEGEVTEWHEDAPITLTLPTGYLTDYHRGIVDRNTLNTTARS